MKKSNKKNYVAIVLIVLLLALAVGYAAFSSQLTITGTATAKAGTWDVKFETASATPSIVTGTAANSATVTDDKTVTVTVNLATPGDGSTVTAKITNNGSVGAKLTGFNVSGLTKVSETVYQTGAIKVTVPTVKQDGTDVIASGASKTFTFSVEWDSSVDEATVGTKGQTGTFDITFTYDQAGVGSFTGTQSFN